MLLQGMAQKRRATHEQRVGLKLKHVECVSLRNDMKDITKALMYMWFGAAGAALMFLYSSILQQGIN
jgi:hypothetical protein